MNPAETDRMWELQKILEAYNARPTLANPDSDEDYADQAPLIAAECARWAQRYADAYKLHDETVTDPLGAHIDRLREKYGPEECARVLAWHTFSGSTMKLDGPSRYEFLDFPSPEDSFTGPQGLFAQNQVQVYVGFPAGQESGIQAST